MKTMSNGTDGKVAEYLALLDEIRSKVGEELVAVEILREISKDRRMEQIRAERRGLVEVSHDAQSDNGNGTMPATLRQKEYLLDLGIKIPQGLSKQKASELLEEAIAQRE